MVDGKTVSAILKSFTWNAAFFLGAIWSPVLLEAKLAQEWGVGPPWNRSTILNPNKSSANGAYHGRKYSTDVPQQSPRKPLQQPINSTHQPWNVISDSESYVSSQKPNQSSLKRSGVSTYRLLTVLWLCQLEGKIFFSHQETAACQVCKSLSVSDLSAWENWPTGTIPMDLDLGMWPPTWQGHL